MDSPPSSDSGTCPSAAAADYPRWVMLDRGERWQGTSTGDATTSASCNGSIGNTVHVSFRLAAPPAVSTLHVDARLPCGWTYKNHTYEYDAPQWYHVLVSAHRDSVLVELSFNHGVAITADNFVYIAGARGGARLLLLPPPCKYMCVGNNNTGILRRGGDEFVVASLVIGQQMEEDPLALEASMCGVLCSDECKWEHWDEIPVRHADGHEAELSGWYTGSVITVGDRFLYWIDLTHGIIFSDVTVEIPELRYVPLPVDPMLAVTADGDGDAGGAEGRYDPRLSRNVCLTVDGAVRFVRVSPRCCCGRPGNSSCPRSQRAFTVTTWTLMTDDLTWHQDCVLDSGELWASAVEADDVPLVPPVFPVLGVEDPDVVRFVSSEAIHRWQTLADDSGDKALWLVAVDMRRKKMRSVCRYPEDDDFRLFHQGRQSFLPSEVSSYFGNTCHGGDYPMAMGQEDKEEMMEVLAAIREIPDMARDEMLRAHNLVTDDDRRVRFLAALPLGIRKEHCQILTDLERNLMTRSHQSRT